MDLSDALLTFQAEAHTLLQEMETGLMRLEAEPGEAEALNAVFRAVHTIKGSAGLFGLQALVGFAHGLESLLDQARCGRLTLTGAQIGRLLQCGDHLQRLLEQAITGGTEAGDPEGARLLALLGAAPAGQAAAPVAGPAAGAGVWHLSLRFSPGLFQEGFDPASFIAHLATLGEVLACRLVDSALPDSLEALDPELCLLGFEIRLLTAAGREEIEAVFDFIRGECQLRLLPPDATTEQCLALIEALPAERRLLDEMLLAAGATGRQARAPAVEPQGGAAVGAPAGEGRAKAGGDSRMIRVPADKLDALIHQVAELLIASAVVGSRASIHRDRGLRESVGRLARLTEGVRDGAMRLRMVEIGETFGRFHRVVRDVSQELGKSIDLSLEGSETELDKSMVDRLSDPLVHLVRNAIDHGIEAPAERAAAGKPARARLRLAARQEGGGIVIEVADDGRGLDRQRILAKAVERGLVAAGTELDDAQVWALIFEPGFSTAAQVSNLSGRGVGMDVVKRGIESMRGSIEIDSVAGRGTVFRLRLPLTLAIIDGFLLAVGSAHYVVPLALVQQCVRLDAADGRLDCLDLRGEALPLLRLRRVFGVEGPPPRRENVVVVKIGARRAGLVVDALKGELQAVIRPLGPLLHGLPGIAGSTILGTGEVALTLDLPALLDRAARAAAARPSLNPVSETE